MGKSFDIHVVSVVHYNDCRRPLDSDLDRLSSAGDLRDRFLHSRMFIPKDPQFLNCIMELFNGWL